MIETISYILNKDDYLKARFEGLMEGHLKFKSFRKWFLLIILLILLCVLFRKHIFLVIFFMLIIELLLSIIFAKVFKIFINLFLKNWEDKNIVIKINSEDQKFEIINNDNVDDKMSVYWNIVTNFYNTKNFYLLTYQAPKNNLIIIPKKIFASQEKLNKFEKLVKYMLDVYT